MWRPRVKLPETQAGGRRPPRFSRAPLGRPFARRRAVGVAVLAIAVVAAAGRADSASLRLPVDIPKSEQTLLIGIADTAPVKTRVDGEPFVGRRDVFEYLLDHPAFATQVTQALQLARLRIWPTADGFFLDEGWGTTGSFRVVHAEAGRRLFYARGEHRARLLPPIAGEAVVSIEYRYTPGAERRDLVMTTVAAFVKPDSRVLSGMLKLGGPLVQKKADHEARGLVRLFAKVSRAIENDPAGVYEKVRARPDVSPVNLEEFRARLGLP